MARGGAREGSGRKPGLITTKAREIAEKGLVGLTPLDFMLEIMRDTNLEQTERFEAAKAAAPYVHAKLAAVEHKGDMTMTTQTKDQRDAAVAAAMRADG